MAGQDAPVPRIVTYVHRPKRPPRKRNAVALNVPAIVRKRAGGDAAVSPRPVGDEPTPANDDRKPPSPAARKVAIATAASRKRPKLRGAEERAAEPDDPEADARVKAFFARMDRPP